ncbi:MAG: V-type ATP synthase subunit F [Candidatus Ratteibacteria bacterium]
MENKIIFIGDKTTIEFFSAFNIETFFASSVKEAEQILEKIDINQIICIFITEEVFDQDKFMKLVNLKKMVVIPSLKSREKKGIKLIDELIKKATGMKGE